MAKTTKKTTTKVNRSPSVRNARDRAEIQAIQIRNQMAQAVVNAYTSRTQTLRNLLDPRRNIDTECGYVTDPSISQLEEMWKKEGIARRVVSVLPEESWKVKPEVYDTEEAEETEFEGAWNEIQEKLHLFPVLQRADRLSGVGRFGVILLGINDGGKLSQEALPGKDRQLMYLRVFDETVVNVKTTENDVSNPRYGQPTMYEIMFSDNDPTNTDVRKTREVHWTRVIHIADNRRMSEIYGESRMYPVFNRLQDIRKISGGSAEMFWQGGYPGLSLELDPRWAEAGVEIDSDAKETLQKELNAYLNGLQRYIVTTGLNAKQLSSQVASPKDHFELHIVSICITLGIPYRVFMGTEEGKLAGTSDAKAWAERIKGRQNDYLTPYVIRPLVDRLIELGILPETKDTVRVSWPDMMTPSDKEKAEVTNILTEALKKYVAGGVDMLMPASYYLTRILGWDQETVDAVLEQVEKGIAEEENELEEDETGEDIGEDGIEEDENEKD